MLGRGTVGLAIKVGLGLVMLGALALAPFALAGGLSGSSSVPPPPPNPPWVNPDGTVDLEKVPESIPCLGPGGEEIGSVNLKEMWSRSSGLTEGPLPQALREGPTYCDGTPVAGFWDADNDGVPDDVDPEVTDQSQEPGD